MKKPIIKIHNSETDEVIEREMTEEEYAVHLERIEADAKIAEEANANEQIKSSAQSKLTALGLTSDEVAALRG